MSLLLDARGAGRADAVATAAAAVRRGELVVLPTDTVYGVAADAFTPAAVTALLAAKGRSRDIPVPVLVGSWTGLDGLADRPTQQTRDLMEAFWPGGLTLVVRAVPTLQWDIGETRGTVALRMPLHPVALDLLRETGPLATSSANRTGSLPAADAEAAREALGESVAVYLDAGPGGAAVPSTVLDLTGGGSTRPRVLRRGTVDVAALREVLPDVLDLGEKEPDEQPPATDAGGASPEQP